MSKMRKRAFEIRIALCDFLHVLLLRTSYVYEERQSIKYAAVSHSLSLAHVLFFCTIDYIIRICGKEFLEIAN